MLSYAADAPSAADWLEAWATLVAAVFSAAALFVALWVLRREQRTRREDKLNFDAAQARLVFAVAVAAIGDRSEGWTGIKIEVRNNSENVISNVVARCSLKHVRGVTAGRLFGIVAVGSMQREDLKFEQPQPWPVEIGDESSMLLSPGRIETSMSFMDSRGLRWFRFRQKEPEPGTTRYRPPGVPTLLARYLRVDKLLRLLLGFARGLRQRVFTALDTKLRERERRELEQWVRSNPTEGVES